MSLTVGALAVAAGAPTRPVADIAQDAPATYTFHMGIQMAMRHFPWFHFHMEGTGDYTRGDRYVVHLTQTPALFSKMRDIDLSMIDPAMWPKRYRYARQSDTSGTTVYALSALDDPSMRGATVGLGPNGSARWVDAHYSDGMHVHMSLTNDSVDGYVLPVSLTADVDYPHMPMSANASFTNYIFPTAPPPAP
ncbi:MAG TPA: hypothetical protein VGF98_02580 [Candidatus Tumulicola sp.]